MSQNNRVGVNNKRLNILNSQFLINRECKCKNLGIQQYYCIVSMYLNICFIPLSFCQHYIVEHLISFYCRIFYLILKP